MRTVTLALAPAARVRVFGMKVTKFLLTSTDMSKVSTAFPVLFTLRVTVMVSPGTPDTVVSFSSTWTPWTVLTVVVRVRLSVRVDMSSKTPITSCSTDMGVVPSGTVTVTRTRVEVPAFRTTWLWFSLAQFL